MLRYKDDAPAGTVQRIRTILAGLGLLPTEQWFSKQEGRCSVRLTAPRLETTLATGGKGATAELALASAYGELIERLQNYLLFPLFAYYEFDEDLRAHAGFAYDPGERTVEFRELAGHVPEAHLRAFRLSGREPHDFLLTGGRIVLVPYRNVTRQAAAHVPFPFSCYLYGSNGMCAGNSREEALVQGLSEVMERFVNRRLVLDRLTPPRIGAAALAEHFPEQLRLIRELEAAGGCRLEVRDCSLGRGLPVIAVILFLPGSGGCFVKLGAHPDLRIALERAIQETFQFRSFEHFPGAAVFDGVDARGAYDSQRNLGEIFHNGAGLYPVELFRTAESYAPDPRRYGRRFADNRECLRALLEAAGAMHWELLVREVGFLGFPAFHVVIPGVSEVNDVRPEDFGPYNDQLVSRQVVRRPGGQPPERLATLARTMATEMSLGNTGGNLALLSRLPLKADSFHARLSYTALLPLLQLKLGRIREAGGGPAPEGLSRELTLYFRCRRAFLNLLARGFEPAEALAVAGQFYPRETVDRVSADCGGLDALLERIGPLPCPDCSACSSRGSCGYVELRALVRALKTRHAAHADEGEELSRLFADCRQGGERGGPGAQGAARTISSQS